MNKLVYPILLTLVLTACGGGGGGSAPQAPVIDKVAVMSIAQTNSVYTEAVGDVNSDGLDDVVVSGWNYDSPTAYVYLLTQNADGTLTNSTALLGNNVVSGSQRVLLNDFDADGHVDIFIPGFGDGSAITAQNSVMYWGNGSGFTRQDWTDHSMAHGSCLADLNNDGRTDILIAGSGVWFNNGSRTFTLNNTILANNYFTACAVIKESNTNTVYLANNSTVPGFRDAVLAFDYQLNLLSQTGFQSDNNFDTVNVTVADLNNDGHKDFVLSLNGTTNGTVGAKKILAYSSPNVYTNAITTLTSNRHAFYDHVLSIGGIDSVLFSGDSANAKLFKGITELYAGDFVAMAPNNAFNPANVYQSATSGKIYMLQLINNTFYTKEMQ